MLGLALEGGGARGAFHMGALKALIEEGYSFDIIAGTSIGAFNAAIVAQGDFELGYNLWQNMTTSVLFDIEDTMLQKIINKKIDLDILSYVSTKLKEFIANKGLDTTKIRQLLEEYVDEDKLRQSKVDLGMITVSLSDFKPLELYKDDIPYGQITSYLMASANFPIFKLEPIDGKYFVDGGVYDNCPINLLVKKGCTEIIAVRTFGIGVSQKPGTTAPPVLTILPSEDLGKVLVFDPSLIERNLKMGYYDAKRALYHLKGQKYYITAPDNDFLLAVLLSLKSDTITQIRDLLSLPLYTDFNGTRLLFEKILPKLSQQLKLESRNSYEDILLALLEITAAASGVPRFEVYEFNHFIQTLIENRWLAERKVSKKSHLLKISLIFLDSIFAALN